MKKKSKSIFIYGSLYDELFLFALKHPLHIDRYQTAVFCWHWSGLVCCNTLRKDQLWLLQVCSRLISWNMVIFKPRTTANLDDSRNSLKQIQGVGPLGGPDPPFQKAHGDRRLDRSPFWNVWIRPSLM